MEKKLPLTEIMKALGMTDLFIGNKADLSGIDGNKDLVVSDAIHKAFVEVKLYGTVYHLTNIDSFFTNK